MKDPHAECRLDYIEALNEAKLKQRDFAVDYCSLKGACAPGTQYTIAGPNDFRLNTTGSCAWEAKRDAVEAYMTSKSRKRAYKQFKKTSPVVGKKKRTVRTTVMALSTTEPQVVRWHTEQGHCVALYLGRNRSGTSVRIIPIDNASIRFALRVPVADERHMKPLKHKCKPYPVKRAAKIMLNAWKSFGGTKAAEKALLEVAR